MPPLRLIRGAPDHRGERVFPISHLQPLQAQSPASSVDLPALRNMLLWLAPPVHAPGDFARQLCRREWWKIERKRTRRRLCLQSQRSGRARVVLCPNPREGGRFPACAAAANARMCIERGTGTPTRGEAEPKGPMVSRTLITACEHCYHHRPRSARGVPRRHVLLRMNAPASYLAHFGGSHHPARGHRHAVRDCRAAQRCRNPCAGAPVSITAG
jgi:hypothetical protein